MSTKIYGGKIFKVKSYYDLNEKLKVLAKSMEKLKKQKVAKKAAEEIADVVDQCVLFGKTPLDYESIKTIGDVFNVLRKKCDEANKSPYRMDADWDLEVTMSLFPLKTGKILGILYAQHSVPAYESLVKRQTWIKDYHYQNSTDRPSRISAREWNKRKKDWDEVFKHESSSMTAGSSFVLATPKLSYDSFENTEKYFPSVKERAENMFKEYQRIEFDKSTEGQALIQNLRHTELHTLFEAQRKFFKENEAKHKEVFNRDLLPKIKPLVVKDNKFYHITIEDLKKNGI